VGWGHGRTARTWAVAAAVAALIFVSWWLLARGTRGAEIANVLALPLAVISTAAGIWALSQRKDAVRARLEDSGGRGLLLVRAKQKIMDQLGPLDTRGPHIALRFERRPDALTRGYKPVGHGESPQWDEHETGLRQILADSHGLLVLGDIGSGKTTVLYELAQDLLPVADELHNQPTPYRPETNSCSPEFVRMGRAAREQG
jgi:hypothetical protein